MNKKILTTMLFMFSLLFLTACSKEEVGTINEEGELKVYTTIYPFQYFTERIGGEYVAVENLIPPGSDAHSVEITMKNMTNVAESKAFIYSGTALEGFANAVIDAVKDEDVKIVNATEGIDFINGVEDTDSEEEDTEEHENEEEHAEHSEGISIDPHVWLDPNRSITIANNIKNALNEISPDNTDAFEENFNSLKQDLEMLDENFKTMVANADSNTFLVSHSAYGYWEEAFGLQQIGISGLSPTDEPSHKELIEIIALVNEQKLQYIYIEPNLTNKVAVSVQRETGLNALTLNNLESISEENIKNNEDYFTIMKDNIEALEQGLIQQ
ncbi:metal ABC transporter solute-binding protein, Zn/Mn family [Psychrobacillus sp. FSL K6-1415]|uniref:metal ABC transporter solute-binding protein, Zn/Mn family n=1 Tax=Psychrobacillus sp. FSL K6-1415 TaxID=2921544 RepID=UPI0030F68934